MANGQPGLPGANILAVVMAAPTDLINLATLQAQQVMSTLNAGAQKFAAAAAVPPAPPALPTGFPMALPALPGMPGAAAAAPPAPAPAPAAAPRTTVYGGAQAMPLYRVTVQT